MVFSIYKVFAQLFSRVVNKITWGQGKLAKRNLGLRNQTVPSLENSIWIHCASLGEFEQGKRVIDSLRAKYPKNKIVLTFFSASGYEKRKSYKKVDHVLYLPYDIPQKMEPFVEALQPDLVVFIKYEFWFSLLDILHHKHIPFVFVSSVFRSDQYLFKRVNRSLLNKIFNARHIFVQNNSSKELLLDQGYRRVSVAGDTRVDRVVELKGQDFSWPALEEWKSKSVCVIAGSTWPEGEKILMETIPHFPDWKWIIAPHELGKDHMNQLKKQMGDQAVFLSEIGLDGTIPADISTLVIDRIGLLSVLYRYGNIAYVGGGMGAGIHNTLEPAVYGLPLLFGPKYKNFQEAVDFHKLGVARVITSAEEMEDAFQYFADIEQRQKFRAILADYFAVHSGATNIILTSIEKIIHVK